MIGHVDYHITDHCNYRCKGCNQFGPLGKEWCVPYDQFCEEWQFVHDKGLNIQEIHLLGGESLLHPELDRLLIFLRQLYPTTGIVVYTNAILLKQQKEKLLPIFNKYNICLFVSKYPNLYFDYQSLLSGFNLSTLADESSFMNVCLHKEPILDQDYAYKHCNTGTNWKCRFLKNYHLYACSMLPNLPLLINYFPELKETSLGKLNVEENGIDIRTHTNEEIEAFVNRSVPACSFCNVDKSKFFRPWAFTNYDVSEWVED